MPEPQPSPPFTLRVPRPEDAPVFARLFDAEVMRFIGDGTVRDAAWYREFIDRQIEAQERSGLCLRTLVAHGEVAGFVGAQRWSAQWWPTGAMELGWRLGRSFWGRGLATSAARRVIAEARTLGIPELVAMVDAQNPASLRVAGRLGMRRVRVHRVRVPAADPDRGSGRRLLAVEHRLVPGASPRG